MPQTQEIIWKLFAHKKFKAFALPDAFTRLLVKSGCMPVNLCPR